MAPKDTPPASPARPPQVSGQNEDEEDQLGEEEELQQEDVVEVIDLDELEDQAVGEDEAMLDEEPELDNSSLTFSEHGGKSVFAVALSHNGQLVLSGGEDDCAYLWTADSGEVRIKLDGFKDSVVAVGFNHNGGLIAAADMGGQIRCWKASASYEQVWDFETGSDVTAMRWHPSANVLLAATAESELWMWRLPSGDSKVMSGGGERAEAMALLADGRRCAVSYGDGAVKVFELRSGQAGVSVTSDSQSAAPALVARDDGNLVAAGHVDGTARVYNVQTGKVVATFACGQGPSQAPDEGEDDQNEDAGRTVESVLFGSLGDAAVLITGTLEGSVSIWDLGAQTLRLTAKLEEGVVKMAWRNGQPGQLLASTLGGRVHVLDARSGQVLLTCAGHRKAILDMDQSKDGHILVTSSDDGTCKVYKLTELLTKE